MKTASISLIVFGLAMLMSAPAGEDRQAPSPDAGPGGLQKSDWQYIRAAHEAWKHEFRQVDGGWLANNPGQRWTTRFDGRGFLAKPRDADWTWGLKLESYGFGGKQETITGSPEIKTSGQRLSYHWQGGLEEWFVNDGRGLEHGFIVADRPEGARDGEPLVFTLSTLGTLKPSLSADARSVHFRDALGAPVLNYSGLKVWDADGTTLPSRFEREMDGRFRITVEEKDARYPITIDPIAQQAYLKASNNGGPTDDQFGRSVAVSGETVVVGVFGEDSGTSGVDSIPDETLDSSGAAYVFVRNGGTWSQQAYLKASNPGESDLFGNSVAVDGDTVVVGAYEEDSGSSGVDSIPDESLEKSGAAYVFTRNGSTWTQQAYLKASNPGAMDRFGISVAVSGDTVVVGAHGEDSGTSGVNSTPNNNVFDSGAVYVFTRSRDIWTQQAYIKASNPGGGDNFGHSVGVSGDTLVAGAIGEDSSSSGVNSIPNEMGGLNGAAYVFTRVGNIWSQQAYLKASNSGMTDFFGVSVAVSGNTVVVGAYGESSGTSGVNSTPDDSLREAGAAYVFTRSVNTWSQQAYLKASNPGMFDRFGYSVAVSGDTVVVGAYQEDSNASGVNGDGGNNSSGDSGAAYVFTRVVNTWSQQAYLKASNPGANDLFGFSVAVSGDTVIAGAHREDSRTRGVNPIPDDMATDAGAAYVFTLGESAWTQQSFLKASNNPDGPGLYDEFGISVAISGDTVVVGARYEDSTTGGVNSTPNEGAFSVGAAYVFTRDGGIWSQQAYLKASNPGAFDQFGSAVAVSGDTVVVGAYLEDSGSSGINTTPDESALDSGAVYVFTRDGTTWSQQAYLKAANPGPNDQFGSSVAVSGDTVVVGAYLEDSNASGVNGDGGNNSSGNSGAVYVFTRSGTTWSQQAYLKASNAEANDQFGYSVGVSEDTVIAGAPQEDSGTSGVNTTPDESASGSGAAYVFTRGGNTWSQQAYLKASNPGSSDQFGYSVAVSGNTAVAGAIGEDSNASGVNGDGGNNSSGNAGAAYVFTRDDGTWSQQAYLKASDPGPDDQFGCSVAVSGNTVAVGAIGEDSATSGVNSTPDQGASSAGAVYVFIRGGGNWSQQAYLKSSNPGPFDWFGTSVGLSGDTLVVGANGEDSSTSGVNTSPEDKAVNSGAAYIFTGVGPVVAPEIVISQSGGTIDNGATKNFGSVATGDTLDLVFTISNTGDANLELTGTPAVSPSGNPDFTITEQPSGPITGPGGSSTFVVRFTPTGSGLKSATLTILSNDDDESLFTIELTGTATTASALFAETISANTSLTGNDAFPRAIPYDDGIENLLKYAFNMNLDSPDVHGLEPGTGTSGLPSITTPDDAPPGTLRFEFLRRKGSGLHYTPQKNTTLDGPGWAPLTAAPVITSIDNQWERVVYTEPPAPIPVPACFGRVSVTMP